MKSKCMNICSRLVMTIYACPFCGAEYMVIVDENNFEEEYTVFNQGEYDHSILTHNKEFQCELCQELLRVPD